jgi:shikimate kinase
MLDKANIVEIVDGAESDETDASDDSSPVILPKGAVEVPKHYRIDRNVFLVGFMGAGKSSVARRLARNFGLASVDMDSYIERREGEEIPQIFAERGEDGFRDAEAAAFKDVCEMGSPMIVSCGGGIVMRQGNRNLLRRCGFCIHLVVQADEAAMRIDDTLSRPLFNSIKDARRRCAARMPRYHEVAHAEIDTHGKTVSEITREVANILTKEGILCLERE